MTEKPFGGGDYITPLTNLVEMESFSILCASKKGVIDPFVYDESNDYDIFN